MLCMASLCYSLRPKQGQFNRLTSLKLQSLPIRLHELTVHSMQKRRDHLDSPGSRATRNTGCRPWSLFLSKMWARPLLHLAPSRPHSPQSPLPAPPRSVPASAAGRSYRIAAATVVDLCEQRSPSFLYGVAQSPKLKEVKAGPKYLDLDDTEGKTFLVRVTLGAQLAGGCLTAGSRPLGPRG